MAYSVTNKVRIADESSQYRKMTGVVMAVDDDDHDVRLDGHGCGTTQRFTTGQLKLFAGASPVDYSECQ